MNTEDQTKSIGIATGASNQTPPPAKPVCSTFWVSLRKHWLLDLVIFLLSLSAIAFIHHQDKNVPALTLRQKNEGFGIALFAIGCCLFSLWRLSRFFAKDEQSTESLEEGQTSNNAQQPPRDTPSN
jgi:hypothetical protein